MKPRKSVPASLENIPFTTRQAHAAGMGRQRLRGKDLVRPFRGVYAVDPSESGVGELGVAELCRILQVRLPDHAFFCDVTAAQVMRIPLPAPLERSRVLHVGVPAPRTAPTGKGIRGRSVHIDAGDIRRWDGLRVTSAARTWCALGAALTVPQLVAAGDYLIHWASPLASRDDLAAAVDRHGRRAGARVLRGSLPLLDERSESPKESELRVILVTAGLHGLAVNLPITTSDGYRYRADLAFPRERAIVEYQSRFHEAALNFRADMTRISRLEADGWIVIQVNNDDLADPAELVRRVRRVLAVRRGPA
jgi:very-short-patch-repair endonuclease